MRRLLLILWVLTIVGCGASKKSQAITERTISVAAADKERRGETPKEETKTDTPSITEHENFTKADEVINTALTFSGVRYKFGGTTNKGMDCSGLLYVSFGEHDVKLPRTSIHMAEEGKKIKIKDVTKGDLLFFKTNKRSKRINHVGMVVKVENDEIKFIHASTSRGVTVSSLHEGFWNQAFVKATRIL
ncbi:C40 family peptidase [Maribacter sp. CXY002]|uniref:C40 family peptidase n=1 Tax=Maribacter luteocoastalis TaxID=3407671 RepID=UPI003B66D953